MKIKTLAEILAESDTDSASNAAPKAKKASKNYPKTSKNSIKPKSAKLETEQPKKPQSSQLKNLPSNYQQKAQNSKSSTTGKAKKRKKRFHPAARFQPDANNTPTYQPPQAQSIRQILAEVKRDGADERNGHDENSDYKSANAQQKDNASKSAAPFSHESSHEAHDQPNQPDTDNLPSALKAYLRTPEQKQAEIDAIKAESRLRWLAFYYLSRREYGRAELKQKLIDKEQDPDRIEALLDEFEDKGYQSDYRTTLMLIRENIRKGRGRARIKQEFYHKKIAMPGNIDELIEMANAESDEFSEFVEEDADSLVEGVDWLKLAVTARTKKYGDDIPTEPKEKAKQLRFLQYRGFKSDICFAALNYTLETLDERF